jgi:hypothetical protein
VKDKAYPSIAASVVNLNLFRKFDLQSVSHPGECQKQTIGSSLAILKLKQFLGYGYLMIK